MDKPAPLTQRPQWQALAEHATAVAGTRLRDLFAADPARGGGPGDDCGEIGDAGLVGRGPLAHRPSPAPPRGLLTTFFGR